ncbi:SufS family cysteine desulfurase [Arcanobacterium hippocoleae]
MAVESSTQSLFPRADFPILGREIAAGVPLVYLDSGATAQLPSAVVNAVVAQELQRNGAVNRGSHRLAAEATDAYENAREKIAGFVGVLPDEIIWTRSTTESLNLLAYAIGNYTLGRRGRKNAFDFNLGPNDSIVVTRAEHHANLLPWQELCLRTGAQLRWIDLHPDGTLDLNTAAVIDHSTKIVAFAHISNVTGAVAPVRELVAIAHSHGALAVLDACQSLPHIPVNFADLDVDFAAFSAHKMFGPAGIGALYGRSELLETLPPFQYGGSMIELVQMEKTTYARSPMKFEAGTQPVPQIVGFAAAVDYLQQYGMDQIEKYEADLTAYLLTKLQTVPQIQILGPRTNTGRIGVAAFEVPDVHPHDVGQILDSFGVAARVGHHCAQPIHQHFGVRASSRVSIAPYNTKADIDVFIAALGKVRAFFGLED